MLSTVHAGDELSCDLNHLGPFLFSAANSARRKRDLTNYKLTTSLRPSRLTSRAGTPRLRLRSEPPAAPAPLTPLIPYGSISKSMDCVTVLNLLLASLS